MKTPRVCAIYTDGVNCEQETMFGFREQGAIAERVHVNELRSRARSLTEFNILAVSGGFSYGDDVAAGKVLATEFTTWLADDLRVFYERPDTLIIGICNGFQVLTQSGLLPFGELGKPSAVLTRNASGSFECRTVSLQKAESRCTWVRDVPAGTSLELPVAHEEGRLWAESEVLARIEREHLVVFRYAKAGQPTMEYPANPNGSMNAIAGLTDPTGRVLGLMPHPERNILDTQMPNWRRGGGVPWGRVVFQNAVSFALAHS